MSRDEESKLAVQVQGMKETLQEVLTAIQGNDSLGVDGVTQHMEEMSNRLTVLEQDVKGLKMDKAKFKAWVAGLASGGGFLGVKISEWLSK